MSCCRLANIEAGQDGDELTSCSISAPSEAKEETKEENESQSELSKSQVGTKPIELYIRPLESYEAARGSQRE